MIFVLYEVQLDNKYMLFAGWEVRSEVLKMLPETARTDPKPVITYLFFPNEKKITEKKLTQALL